MRSVTVVCDNHHNRPAVATYYVSTASRPGYRSPFPGLETPRGRYYDLCTECAAVLGWHPEPEPEVHAYEPDEPISDAQRRLLFARCRDIGIDEDKRHAILEMHAGDPSVRNLLAKDFDRIMVALDIEADRRRLTHGGSR